MSRYLIYRSARRKSPCHRRNKVSTENGTGSMYISNTGYNMCACVDACFLSHTLSGNTYSEPVTARQHPLLPTAPCSPGRYTNSYPRAPRRTVGSEDPARSGNLQHKHLYYLGQLFELLMSGHHLMVTTCTVDYVVNNNRVILEYGHFYVI